MKDRDLLSSSRLYDRWAAMADDQEMGDPADDEEFCNEVLQHLGALLELVTDEIDEDDPDATTAWARRSREVFTTMIAEMRALLGSM